VVNRIVSGARYGLRDWLMQRIAAIILLIYSLFVMGFILLNLPLNFNTWHALFNHDWMRFITLLFFIALYLHAWVGIRNVLMDYVHSTAIRLTLHGCAIVALILYFIWTVQILWGK
jgi:succinate dehydrogenase / fumarate reductase membrane anchor subunit